jgi:N-formylglutamate amidohydrolase
MVGVCAAVPPALQRCRSVLVIACFLALFGLLNRTCAQVAAPKKAPLELERLVTVQKGEIPIILSAPHGGRRSIVGVPARKDESAKQFVTVTDTNTQRLAEALAKSIEKRWGKPYVVVAQFSRQYLDANRPVEDAWESENAKPVYEAYHSALGDAVKETRERWGRGLLIDLHGQAAQKATIFRGTSNGKTCSLLLERLGPDGLMGKAGLLGLLHEQGYEIYPKPKSADKEDSRYNGGHIVRTYGASSGTGIDAVQLELGGDFRRETTIEKTADDLAQAIDRFGDAYFADMKAGDKSKSP